MKKVFLIATLCLLGNTDSFAQIAQGTKWISGSFGLNTSNAENNRSFGFYDNSKSEHVSINASPTFGYFFKENQLIGVGALFSNTNSSSENSSSSSKNNNTSKSNLYGGQILYRKYFPLSSKFYIVTEGNINFQSGKSSSTQKIYENDILATERIQNSNPFKAGLSGKAFIVYFISPKISTELGLGSLGLNYNKSKGTYTNVDFINQQETTNDTKNSSIDFSSSFFFNNISLGFQFYF